MQLDLFENRIRFREQKSGLYRNSYIDVFMNGEKVGFLYESIEKHLVFRPRVRLKHGLLMSFTFWKEVPRVHFREEARDILKSTISEIIKKESPHVRNSEEVRGILSSSVAQIL